MRRTFIACVAAAVAIVVIAYAFGNVRAEPTPPSEFHDVIRGQVMDKPLPAPVDDGGPRKVYVGAYAFQAPEMDLAGSTFMLDFWLWFRWHGEDMDPSKSFEFSGLYEGWDVLKQGVYTDDDGNPAPDDLGNGWRYQVVRYQARFSASFDVRDYPFDKQHLVVSIEDNERVVEDMVYVVDEGSRLVDPNFGIVGWQVEKVTAEVDVREYGTNWGDPRRGPGEDKYSRFTYTVHLKRPVLGYLAITVIPIALVMLITLVVFLVHPKYFEGRLGLAVTTLISAVALQLTAAGNLPATGYVLMLDHIYNLAYFTILLALVESVISVRLYDQEKVAASRKLDRVALLGAGVMFFGITGIMLLAKVL